MVAYLTHPEESMDSEGSRKIKAKTIGKLVDSTLTLEGLFTIVLFSKIKKTEKEGLQYVFETKNNGENTCKSPEGMFDSNDIPNNLELVRTAIINYEN